MHPDEKRMNEMTENMFDWNDQIHILLKRLITVSLLMMLCVMPRAAGAADWEIAIKVQSGTAYNDLVIGADATATNAYDAVWETYALMGGTVEAYFPHPEWGLVHQEFHREIKAHYSSGAIEWPLTVNSSLTNANFTISWDLTGVPQDYPALLIDQSTGQQTDMRSAGSYNFTYTGIRSFRIQVTESCTTLPVRIAGTSPVYYSTLQDAYNAAVSGDIIESHAEVLTGNLNINLNKSVTLAGGYNCNYSSVSGSTTLSGTLSITNGSASIENIIVQ